VCLLLLKELSLLCFDPDFAGAQGWPVIVLDIILMALVVAVTVVGLQAVGLIMMVALLVIPPAAARFWTHHLPTMLLTAGTIGALSGYVGATISALTPRLPAGAVIVLACGAVFLVSVLFGSQGGALARLLLRVRLSNKIRRQHLLRALYEDEEQARATREGTPTATLLRRRSWTPRTLRRTVADCAARGWVLVQSGSERVRLSDDGRRVAWRVTRNHRLWELFLITHADIAASHVDRDADMVEHVLDPRMVEQLERELAGRYPNLAEPISPHVLQAAGGAA
jgi:manganese/zinc/iron transport system permease protein